jgi:O-antigen ligase
MNLNSINTRLLLSLFHLALGVLLLIGIVAKVYSTIIVLFGVLFIIKSKNEHNEAILWSAYLVGAEVLFRMSGGMFFYELPKYAILIFLLIGLYVEKKKHHISITFLVYILLLLVGIAFTEIPFTESIRKAVAFNLSGPILLGISAIYFYNRKITLQKLMEMLFYMGLPVISMLSYLFFETPNVKDINFGGAANFEASGGFGPNQVATILGLGIFIVSIHLFLKKRIFSFLIIDIFLFIYLIFRGLITFSRGGIVTSFIAIIFFVFFYIRSTKEKLKNTFKFLSLGIFFGIALLLYTSNLTGGMLLNRYTNKNAMGIEKKDISTGRVTIFETDIEGFLEHPFFGLGVGGSKYYRLDKLKSYAASHNEISRLLSEHGMIGLVILFLLIIVPIKNIRSQSNLGIAFLGAFFLFWFLTINHSAMRIAFPGFIYGLSLITFKTDEENSLYRE